MISREAFRLIRKIKELGCKAGIVLNPADSIDSVYYYLPLIDKVTVMVVDAGFADQKFIPQMVEKIEKLAKLREEKKYSYLIEVDGSCNEKTYKMLTERRGGYPDCRFNGTF